MMIDKKTIAEGQRWMLEGKCGRHTDSTGDCFGDWLRCHAKDLFDAAERCVVLKDSNAKMSDMLLAKAADGLPTSEEATRCVELEAENAAQKERIEVLVELKEEWKRRALTNKIAIDKPREANGEREETDDAI